MIAQTTYCRRVRQVAEGGSLLVMGKANVAYLSGTDAAVFMLIPLDGEPILGASRMEAERAEACRSVGEVRAFQTDPVRLREGERCAFMGCSQFILELAKEAGISRLRYDTMSEKTHSELSALQLERSQAVEEMRKIKSEEEIALLGRARDVIEEVYQEVSFGLEEGFTELEVAGQVIHRTMSAGWEPAFDPLVAFGDNSAFPHHASGRRKVSGSSVLLMDLGAKVGGYCSDITRTVVRGDAGAAASLEKARAAVGEISDGLQAGMELSEADLMARKLLGEEARYLTHNLGHGLGLEVHEGPILSPGTEDVLSDGMAFTIEPGVYVRGRYGVRWEEDFVCRRGRVRSIRSYI